MADTKYSALAVTTAASSNVWAVAQSGTSWAVYQSSVAAVPVDLMRYGQQSEIEASSAASTLTMFGQDHAGRLLPSVVDVGGINITLQPSLWDVDVFQWYPTSGTAATHGGQHIGVGAVSLGTISTALPTFGNRYTLSFRGTYRASTAAANLTAGVCQYANMYHQGSTAGVGGYFFYAKFGLDTFNTSTRYFVGLANINSSAVCTSNVTTMVDSVGFGFNAQSTAADPNGTSFVFFHSSSSTNGTRTETLLGQPALATGNAYEVYIYAPPNTTRIYYRMDDFNNRSTLVNSSVGLHLPHVTTMLAGMAMSGQLAASSGAARIGIVKLYAERIA